MWGDSYSFCKNEPNVNIKVVSMFGVDNLDTHRRKSFVKSISRKEATRIRGDRADAAYLTRTDVG